LHSVNVFPRLSREQDHVPELSFCDSTASSLRGRIETARMAAKPTTALVLLICYFSVISIAISCFLR
jgi:hypothetical protein